MKKEDPKRNITLRNHFGDTLTVCAEELVFRPSVYGLLFDGDTILLSPQWDGYDFPGGGVEKGESLEEAFVREFHEETGLIAECGDLLGAYHDLFVHNRSKTPFQSVLLYYFAKNPQGEISDAHFDEEEYAYMKKAEWIALSDIDALKFYNPIDSPALIRKAHALWKAGGDTA